MKRITFGTPEKFVPSYFCKNFNYEETNVSYDTSRIKFKETAIDIAPDVPYEHVRMVLEALVYAK